ncbi:MAG TPA: hypothetical protein DEP66_03100, partial [Acidimicrobiaceae bacterium]|nr:hypothetical protein [Acidimicrobiaceae bacterium]
TASGGCADADAVWHEAAGLSAVVGGLANGTRYWFRVRARNVAGPSVPSGETSAVPAGADTTAPVVEFAGQTTGGDHQFAVVVTDERVAPDSYRAADQIQSGDVTRDGTPLAAPSTVVADPADATRALVCLYGSTAGSNGGVCDDEPG